MEMGGKGLTLGGPCTLEVRGPGERRGVGTEGKEPTGPHVG